MDEFDDPELTSALRRHADRGGPPLDVGQAFESVRHRARRRRVRNVAVGTAGALAAVAGFAVAIGALTPERDVVRTPATVSVDTGVVPPTPSPAPTTSVAPGPTTSPTSTMPRPTTTSPRPTTTTRATTTTTRPATTTSAPAGPGAPGTTETYPSDGGSITVRLADGHVSLVGAPEPAAGYTVRIDDDGPYEVRVRFESAAGVAEIRVEVVDGELSPTIRNPDSSGSGSDGSGSDGSNSGPGSGDNSGSGSGDNSGPGSGDSGDNSGSSSSGSSGSGSGSSGSGAGSGSGSGSSGSSG